MVYGIVQQNRGTVDIESGVGRGTVVSITLPREEVSLESMAVVEEATPVRPEPVPTATILLVEDDRAVRTLARKVLEGAGYRVLPAANGLQAIMICEQEIASIDLLLTDIVMPKMSGPELIERLAPWRRNMAILVMSGYAEEEHDRRGILNEMEIPHLQKPFTPEELRRLVSEILEQHCQARDPKSA